MHLLSCKGVWGPLPELELQPRPVSVPLGKELHFTVPWHFVYKMQLSGGLGGGNLGEAHDSQPGTKGSTNHVSYH